MNDPSYDLLDRRIAEILARHERGPHTGGTGGGGGDMEPRIAKLEASVEHIERDIGDLRAEGRQMRGDMRADFRLTWAGIIGLGLLLSGAWYQMDGRLDGLETQLTGAHAILEQIDDKLQAAR